MGYSHGSSYQEGRIGTLMCRILHDECGHGPEYMYIYRIDDITDTLRDANMISKIDATCGYWKIPVVRED